MIGDPDVRLTEDPIRTLRALRFSHKLGFVIEPTLRESMARHAGLLQKAVLPRRREELLKLLRLANPMAVLLECHDLGVLREIFPTLERMFETADREYTFLTLLESLHASVTDSNDTGQVFGWLLATILETLNEENISMSEDELGKLMRDELGMYKFEQSLVLDALKLRRAFENTDEHRRKGERRQAGVVKREGFSLALRLAVADHRVSPSDLQFWTEVYDRIRPEIEEARRERSAKRAERPPRRRRERGGRPPKSGAESVDQSNDDPDGDHDELSDDLGDGLQAEHAPQTRSETSSQARSETSSQARSETSSQARSETSSQARSETSSHARSESSSQDET